MEGLTLTLAHKWQVKSVRSKDVILEVNTDHHPVQLYPFQKLFNLPLNCTVFLETLRKKSILIYQAGPSIKSTLNFFSDYLFQDINFSPTKSGTYCKHHKSFSIPRSLGDPSSTSSIPGMHRISIITDLGTVL